MEYYQYQFKFLTKHVKSAHLNALRVDGSSPVRHNTALLNELRLSARSSTTRRPPAVSYSILIIICMLYRVSEVRVHRVGEHSISCVRNKLSAPVWFITA